MLDQIAAIVREAGKLILKARASAVHYKEGHFNFVTDTDVAVQAFLKRELLRVLPEAGFFSEEQENEPLTDRATFVVDPIDGTVNFTRNRSMSAISIGLMEKKRPVMGVVCNPYADEIVTAEKGRGAYLNGSPIRVSRTPFDQALVVFGTAPYDAELAARSMRCAQAFLLRAGDIRRSGSAAIDLADVACGRADLFFELRLRPWDVAAGSLLVQEAGGNFYSLGHDRPYYDDACGILAANPRCSGKAMDIVSRILAA